MENAGDSGFVNAVQQFGKKPRVQRRGVGDAIEQLGLALRGEALEAVEPPIGAPAEQMRADDESAGVDCPETGFLPQNCGGRRRRAKVFIAFSVEHPGTGEDGVGGDKRERYSLQPAGLGPAIEFAGVIAVVERSQPGGLGRAAAIDRAGDPALDEAGTSGFDRGARFCTSDGACVFGMRLLPGQMRAGVGVGPDDENRFHL